MLGLGLGINKKKILKNGFAKIVTDYSLLHAWNTLTSGGLDIVGTTTTFNDLGTIGGKNLINGSAAAQPTFTTPNLLFDGINDELVKSGTFRNADATGVFTCVIKATDNTLNQSNRIFYIYQTGVNTFFGIDYRNLNPRLVMVVTGVTQWVVESNVAMTLNTRNKISFYQNGTITKIMLNGTVVATTTTTGTNDNKWLSQFVGGNATDGMGLGVSKSLITSYGKVGVETLVYNAYTNETDILNLQNAL